ncbi:MAG: hypothetical protein ACREJC_10280 [Tepidisphaeraceae bacterium]
MADNYIVLKWTGAQEVALDRDGTPHDRLEQAELLTLPDAQAVAARFGGVAVPESRLFPDLDD